MLDRLRQRWGKRLLVATCIGLPVLAFLLLGPPKLLEKSESPVFCGSCHSMAERHLTWSHSPHRTLKCVDCHLPNDHFVSHYFWKAVDGGKDLLFEMFPRQEHDMITLTGHGQTVLQQNCIQCHEQTVANMNQELSCIQCHRKAGHKMTTNHLFVHLGGQDEKP